SLPCLRLRRFSTNRRKPGASNRSASLYLLLQKINQLHMWIETNHARRISDEVRKRIDVVKEQRPIAIVHDVLNSTDVDLCRTNDSLYRSDHFRRWCKRFDSQTRTRCIDRARHSRQFNSVSGLADVSRAKIERVACGEDPDRVEILSAECFNARD